MEGWGNIAGPILGALLIETFERGMSFIKDYVIMPIEPLNFRIIVIGLLLIFFVLYRPDGILGERSWRCQWKICNGNEVKL